MMPKPPPGQADGRFVVAAYGAAAGGAVRQGRSARHG
jgi:hypothetical protein